MSKRRLTKQQKSRIAKRQSEPAAHSPPEQGDANLGPHQHGTVVAHFGKQVEVETSENIDNENELDSELRTERLRKKCHVRANVDQLVTGDNIHYREGEQGAVVTARLPRSSTLHRPDKYGKLKPVAANIDQVLITIAPTPQPHAGLIDRYIVAAENAQMTPVITCNKSDLHAQDDTQEIKNANQKIEKIIALYTSLGYLCIRTTAKTETHANAAKTALEQTLKDKVSIFVGQSGVGKSSIIKAISANRDIVIGDLSHAQAKGRHTTTHSEMFHFKFGGSCIDSPGIREFGMWHLTEDEVTFGFKEIRMFARQCKFRDCKHLNEPACEVLAARDRGDIDAGRLESYFRIIQSLNDISMR